MTYLLIFLIAGAISGLMTPLSVAIGHRWQLTDQPGGRRRHQGVIPRTGGLALFSGFVGAGLLIFVLSSSGMWPPMGAEDRNLLTGVLIGSGVIFFCGLWDDHRDLPAGLQLAAQLLVALIAIYFEVIFERATLPLIGVTPFGLFTYPLTIFWIVGMINTVNWLDGLDGLAAGVAAIASLLFAIHAFHLGQEMVALFPLALTATCLGFLPFNFHPARVFMGSSGSMLLGFALATLSILAPAKIATALLVLGIPILDVAWLIIHRWRRQGNPTLAGRDHLHYRLFDLGFSQRQIVLLYYGYCAAFGLLALLITNRLYKLLALLAMGSLTLLLLWWLARNGKDVAGTD